MQKYLEERGIGFDVGVAKVPLVCQSCLFDLVAVNALDDIYASDGTMVAGLLNEEKTGLSNTLEELLQDVEIPANLFTCNTTLGVIVTNARLQKTQLCKVAGMAHNGYARAIRPVHTTADGDSIYALSLGDVSSDINLIGAMAAMTMERAILRAVRAAKGAYGLPSYEDINMVQK